MGPWQGLMLKKSTVSIDNLSIFKVLTNCQFQGSQDADGPGQVVMGEVGVAKRHFDVAMAQQLPHGVERDTSHD